jgi:hypothetical protein
MVPAARIGDQLRAPGTGERPPDQVLLEAAGLDHPPAVLTIGALHVTVDALNELDNDAKAKVVSWIKELRRRYPRTPVIACHRFQNYQPGLLPFPTVALDKVRAEQARKYIFDYLRAHQDEVPDHEEVAGELARLLLDDPEHHQVRDLAQTPLFLWMIVERYRETHTPPTSRGQLFTDFSCWYLDERHHADRDEPVARRFSFGEKAPLLQAIAYRMVENGSTEIAEDSVGPIVADAAGASWREVLEETVQAEMLHRGDGNLQFMHQSFQEFFAARQLLASLEGDRETLARKVLSFAWQDTFSILLGFAGDHEPVVEEVIAVALEADAALAARCMRVPEHPDPRLIQRFLSEQAATLRDPAAGSRAWEVAATALGEYGAPATWELLAAVAVDSQAPSQARAQVLRTLADMVADVRFERVAGSLERALAKSIKSVLEEPAPVDVRVAAVDAAATGGLIRLNAYLQELLEESQPWELIRPTVRALNLLEMDITKRQQAALEARYRRQLAAVEDALPRASEYTTVERLEGDRAWILERLPLPADLATVLRRRFAFHVGETVGRILDQAEPFGSAVPDGLDAAVQVLEEDTGQVAAAVDRRLRLLVEGDELTAAAAAHRLTRAYLDEGYLDAGQLLRLLERDLAPDRLRAVAALLAATPLPAEAQDAVLAVADRLARRLGTTVTDVDGMEALVTLLDAVEQLDPARGIQLKVVVRFLLQNRDELIQLRFHWPWRVMVFPTSHAADLLPLLEQDDDAWAVIDIIGGWGQASLFVADDLGSIMSTAVSDEHRERLAALSQAAPNLRDHVNCAASAALLRAWRLLPHICELATRPEFAETTREVSSRRFGILSLNARADLLYVIGYLSRVKFDADEDPGEAVAFLRELDLTGADRQTLVGRATGLAISGTGNPSSSSCDGERPGCTRRRSRRSPGTRGP